MSTVHDIQNLVRLRCDIVNSQYITDSELIYYINGSAAELDDLLIGTYEDYKLSSVPFTITSGNSTPLPADFLKLRGVDLLSGQATPISLDAFNFQERNAYTGARRAYQVQGTNLVIKPDTCAPGSYTLWYTPRWSDLSQPTDSLPAHMNVQNWNEYIVTDVCIKVTQKQNLDATGFMQQKEALRQRVLTIAQNRDSGRGQTISRVRDQDELGDLGILYGYWR